MAKNKLEGHIDEIIEMLIDGKTYREIAKHFDVSLSTLHDFTSKSEHSARVIQALHYSASTFDDMAEQVLREAEKNSIEIQRARELAQHYRWKAAKRYPKKYSERVDVTSDGQAIQQIDLSALVGGFMKDAGDKETT